MSSTPILRTSRTLLRPFADADAPALLALLRDPEVTAFLPVFPLRTLEEARAFMRRPGLFWAVCLQDAPVGYVHIGEAEPFDVGYALQKRFWGRAIAAEAARAALDFFRECGAPYATATHDVNNPRSGAVMRKLGMTYRYTYREQWQPKNIPVLFRLYQLNLSDPQAATYAGYWQRYAEHFIEPGL